jgi:MraZ protein
MFLGRYEHSIDEKGRLTIPARYRDFLLDGGFIAQGLDGNLQVMTTGLFNRYYERITSMNMADPHARALRRIFLGTAERIEPDRLGRILIPQFLRQSVLQGSDVIMIGQGEYFEIWSTERWNALDQSLQNPEENEERFSTLDLKI